MQQEDTIHPIPYNVGEAVIEPFWTTGFHALPKWQIGYGPDTGARIYERWAMVNFEWMRPPRTGPVFTMRREAAVDCSAYQTLTLAAIIPARTRLTLVAETDRGERRLDTPPGDGTTHEYALDLEGAQRLSALRLECQTEAGEPLQGSLLWIGLENPALLQAHLDYWQRRGRVQWERYLATPAEPTFLPRYGIFLKAENLEALRRKHAALVAETGDSPFLRIRRELQAAPPPETQIREHIGTEWEYLVRERDKGKYFQLVGRAREAAYAGMVLQDRDCLELAVKYAVALAACDKWTESFISSLPGCEFETRTLHIGAAMEDIAVTLDLAGEFISWHGREYLQRRIADYGLGMVNYTIWRWDYAHQCNQMAAFSRGRLFAYLVLERVWPRVAPYTDMAVEELSRSLAGILHEDGSYAEGPHYIQYTLQTALPAYYHYARSRGRAFEDVLPPVVLQTARYAEALASMDETQEFIPHNDGGTDNRKLVPEAGVFLATMLPRSHWVTAYQRYRQRRAAMPSLIYAWELEGSIPEQGPEFSSFVHLERCGLMASLRRLGGEWVKLLVVGTAEPNPGGHQHEDMGSFVLEFAGQTFAMDSGTYRYDNVHAEMFVHYDRHNVLAPTGLAQRPHMDRKALCAPRGTGDATTFHARVDARTAWPESFRVWTREWDSSEPGELVIRDTYELAEGTGVEWQWQTERDVTLGADTVVLHGKRGEVTLSIPAGCTARLDRLSAPEGRRMQRIVFSTPRASGVIEVRCKLSLK